MNKRLNGNGNEQRGQYEPEEKMKDVFARIDAQLANFSRILQAMRAAGKPESDFSGSLPGNGSRNMPLACARSTKSQWLFTGMNF